MILGNVKIEEPVDTKTKDYISNPVFWIISGTLERVNLRMIN